MLLERPDALLNIAGSGSSTAVHLQAGDKLDYLHHPQSTQYGSHLIYAINIHSCIYLHHTAIGYFHYYCAHNNRILENRNMPKILDTNIMFHNEMMDIYILRQHVKSLYILRQHVKSLYILRQHVKSLYIFYLTTNHKQHLVLMY